jgi:hypothetical protein
MTSSEDELTPWWGDFEIDVDRGGRWDVGPSTLWLYRTEREWRVIYRPGLSTGEPDPLAHNSQATVPAPADEFEEMFAEDDKDLQISRHGFSQTQGAIGLEPALADRPVVSRPENPMHVPAGETMTLYVSTPLWMRVVLPGDRLLTEVPSHRMSDTWFGTSTVEGELCYATRTSGRSRLESLPVRLHRAVTPLKVKNSANDSLLLERVQLPVRHLSLYRDASDALWTDPVRMNRAEGAEGADVQIRTGAPQEAEKSKRIQTARDESKRGLFTSTFGAFGALFGSD